MPNDDLLKDQYYPRYYDDFYGYNDSENDDDWVDPSQYVPRIEGTELELGITFLGLNYLPILTSRKEDRKLKYYLFDFIKIWQTVE